MGIRDAGKIKVGVYPLNEINNNRGTFRDSYTDQFNTDANHTGQLHIISIDIVTKFMEGTFYFKAYNAMQNKSVSITEGKFRWKYLTY